METSPNAHVLAQVRSLMPARPLSHEEMRAVIERQTLRLLALADITGPPVPTAALIARLPRVKIERVPDLPDSGRVSWTGSEWAIRVNAGDAPVRQRFTVAHELGHIVFHHSSEVALPGYGNLTTEARLEKACDIFAACLLMPRPWMKRAYLEGIGDLPSLSQLFDVSYVACRIRMEKLGLTPPIEQERAAA